MAGGHDPGDVGLGQGSLAGQLSRQVFSRYPLRGGDQALSALRDRMRDDPAGAPIDDPAVGSDHAVHQALVQAIDRFEHRPAAIVGIDPEVDPRTLPGYQGLQHHRHGAVAGVQPQLTPVEQGGVGPQRGPHQADVV